jgi:hypothetical protein
MKGYLLALPGDSLPRLPPTTAPHTAAHAATPFEETLKHSHQARYGEEQTTETSWASFHVFTPFLIIE